VSTAGTGRPPTAPEILRDFEVVLDERLADERQRRRKSERLVRIGFGLAVLALLGTALLAYTVHDQRGPGISPVSSGRGNCGWWTAPATSAAAGSCSRAARRD
jgi:hypothetical protein